MAGSRRGHKINEFYKQNKEGGKRESNRQNGSFILPEYIIYNNNVPF